MGSNRVQRPGLKPGSANIISLAAVRADRARELAAAQQAEEHAYAVRIGHRMADAINSGRVDLSRSPLRGTFGWEEVLLARLESALAQLAARGAGRA